VVHRDLKPSNVMLGDFGEVYLLDWGLATLRARDEGAVDVPAEAGHTLAGGTMGTPGYMAPEQIRRSGAVDAAADVYALGAILFELLTLARLHDHPAVAEVLRATLELDGARPAERTPGREISPELDRLCFAATRLDPAERRAGVPSALLLSQRVEAFLDGDRDLLLRRELAGAHAQAAIQALARAALPAEEHAERARAMREVGAALGLDPDNQSARRTLARLITEPPARVPAEAEAEIAANTRLAYRLGAKNALVFYASYLLYLPLLLWMGVRDWSLFALGWVTIAVCSLTTAVLLRRPPRRIDVPLVHLAVSTFTVATVSVLFGAYVLVPMLALGMCVAYT
jgi:serine/threonine-protein kinase